jgi:ABC-2 type transport system ATP-binding protein
MNAFSESIKRVVISVENGSLQQALDDLIDLVDDHSSVIPRYMRLSSSTIRAALSHHQQDVLRGTLTHEQITIDRNRIVESTLHLCDQLVQTFRDEALNSKNLNAALSDIHEHARSVAEEPHAINLIFDGKRLAKYYESSRFHLKPMDVCIAPGQIVAVIGANGSGKTTLLDIIRGHVSPAKGAQLRYPTLGDDWGTIRPKLAYIPQRLERWGGTVRSNLEFAAAVSGITGDANKEWADRLIARYGLSPFEELSWAELSSGYRLRFELALARVVRPQLFVFDEPLANLDIESQQTLLHDIRQIVSMEGGTRNAIVLTSQHLYEVESIANQVILLSGGQRLEMPAKRAYVFMEVWGDTDDGFSEARISEALGPLNPVEIRFQSTVCIIVLPSGTTLFDVARSAQQANLPCTYIRDITRSNRIEMDTGFAGLRT